MYYLNNFCHLCFEHNKNVLSPISLGPSIREVLEYIIPQDVLEKSEVPEQICDECLNNLNNIFKFRKKCLENIFTYNKYLHKLKQVDNVYKSLSVEIPKIVYKNNEKIIGNYQNKDERINKSTNNRMKMETDDYSTLKENQNDGISSLSNEIKLKFEGPKDDFLMKKELNEEVILKDEPISIINDMIHDCIEGYIIEDCIESHDATQEKTNTENSVVFDEASNKDLTATIDIKKTEKQECQVVQPDKLECSYCYRKFRFKSFLDVHFRSHTRDRPFKCHLCKSKFSSSSARNRHARSHTGNRPFPCHLCSKAFTRDENLKTHLRAHDKKPYKCGSCEKRFSHPDKLNEHELIHKPFKCSFCQLAFCSTAGRDIHVRFHSGKRPFSCHLCSKSFTRNQILKLHLQSHNNKPYLCRTCENKFSDHDKLEEHELTHKHGKSLQIQ